MRGILLFIGILATGSLLAQEISKPEMDKIRSGFKKDAYTKAMQNALSSNDISKLAWNRDNVGTTDQLFTYRVDVSGITDQKSSGRCWMFSSLNLFRPMAMKQFNLAEFEFSETYLYFYDLLEKANLFLNNMENSANLPIENEKVRWYLKSPVDDGGQWINFVNLANKYGMVPKETMGETNSSENTSLLTRFINTKLREDAIEIRELKNVKADPKKLAARKTEMLSEIYRMLALNLGEPPTEFQWRYKNKDKKIADVKTYTPQSFMADVFGDTKLEDYVMIMNDPSRPFWKHYEVENYRNTEEGKNWHYVNLPNDVIKEFCIASIKNNEALYASCDVGKQLRRDVGILDVDNFDYESVYGVKFGMNKAQRIETGESGSSHGMALIAVDVDAQQKPVKWQFENSWGPTAGEKGYLTFTDAWFNEYMFRFVVNKKYLTAKVLEIYGQKPEMLPPWDPMF
ncbi:aminopeptidase C [Aquipluma nitroreducens]|uniref:Aminopeptidase n=1 Tax=Aquipluma nitroreducens TaxID=2010828 RepID=A0A5K7SBH5_9BACT|nr:C1 family peptidase [Aquipluma nitroreducens]BBE18806.1 aminopeptidase C [Aquipluma nitroreducens]